MALSAKASQFLEQYLNAYPAYALAAKEAKVFVDEALKGVQLPIHSVASRAKSVNSLRRKVRTKGYRNPRSELTDIVGVRIITYFARDMDAVVKELRVSLDVSKKKSRDARKELEAAEFGYRSAHLIVRLRKADAAKPEYSILKRLWFEIQVRSILDHAWAEIEHEAVYKSGVLYPKPVLRRFHAVAGALEVLEDIFAQLSLERDRLVEEYRLAYVGAQELGASFDVARLLGYLEAVFPNAPSWRSAAKSGAPFAPGLDVACVEALHEVGVTSAQQIADILATKRYMRVLEKFSAMEGLAPPQVSHLARVVLAVAVVNAKVLRRSFSEMLLSPNVEALVRELE